MDDAPELLPTVEEVPTQIEAPVRPGTYIREASLDLLAGLGFGLLVLVGVLVALLVTGRDPGESFSSGWGVAVLLLGTQLPLLFRALRRRKLNRLAKRTVLPLFGGPTGPAVLCGAITGVLLAVLSSLYANTLLYWLGEGSVDNQIDFLKDLLNDRPMVAVLVFLIAVVAPICEEIVFRGVMFGSAHAAGLSMVGVAVSAVLFATVHLIPLLAPFYAFFGVVMCWLYVRTGTLAAPIAAHMAMNGLACAALLLQGDNVV